MTFDIKQAMKHTDAVAAAARTELGCQIVFVLAVYRDGNEGSITSAASGDGIDPATFGDIIRNHLKEIGR